MLVLPVCKKRCQDGTESLNPLTAVERNHNTVNSMSVLFVLCFSDDVSCDSLDVDIMYLFSCIVLGGGKFCFYCERFIVRDFVL